jgi:twitching motility protein PilT
LPHASGRGRVAAFEIMVGTSAIANLIRENNTHQIPSFLQTQRKDGMRTLDQSLSERYAEEIIRRDVAMERAQEPCELENLLRTVDEKRHRL